jgi:cytochrome c oxidase subunit 2
MHDPSEALRLAATQEPSPMSQRRRPSRRTRPGVAASTALIAAIAMFSLLSACGSQGSSAPTTALTGAAAEGKQLANQYFCVDCHSTDGSKRAGPTWKGLFGSTVELTDGRQVVADEAYLRQSITDPQAETAKGGTTTMPHLDLTSAQVDALVAYIETLR